MSKPELKPVDKVTMEAGYQGVNKTTHHQILKLTLGRFYGSFNLKFEDGKVVAMQKVESIKP